MMYHPGKHNFGYRYNVGDNKRVAMAGNHLFQKLITEKDISEGEPTDDTTVGFDLLSGFHR